MTKLAQTLAAPWTDIPLVVGVTAHRRATGRRRLWLPEPWACWRHRRNPSGCRQEAQNIGPIAVTRNGSVSVRVERSSAARRRAAPEYGAVMAHAEVTATTFRPLTAAFPGTPAATLLTRVAKVRAQ